MLKMLKSLKKWNWGVLLVTVLVAIIGALSNKSIPSTSEAVIAGFVFGIPLGLIWAYLTKKD